MAINEILNRKPDLCVSGINHGANSSINVIYYSGTMSAAVEAGVEGVPAIGFSLLDFNYKADFKQGKEFCEENHRKCFKKWYSRSNRFKCKYSKIEEEDIKRN